MEKLNINTQVEHIYQNIDGWFDFLSTYKNIINNAKNGDHFVEVGAWLGKSTSFMAVEIANSGKNIKFDVVDTWEGSPNEEEHKDLIKNLGISLYDKFLENLSPVINYINPIKGYSEDISKLYDDESLDFVFLDASHDYENVKNDIKCWYPKVKKNGIIAGHDYNDSGTEGNEWLGVVKAVDEFFGKENITVRKVHAGTWIIEKEKFENNKIKHIYQNIEGWFDFEDIYTEMVNRFDNALFVELGAAWGKSSSYMAVEIAKSSKNIKFDVIDKWEDEHGSFYDKYLENIKTIRDYINPIKGYSNEVVNQYADNSIDFLFIDASHKYEDVLNDIKLWYHKVKHDGIIAGQDYNNGDFPGVVQAVNEYFGNENIKISNWSWIYQKNIKNMPEYGRGGFLSAVNYIKEHKIENPIIVEIGTQREFNNTGDGCSTTFFSWFVNTYGGKLYSVDIEKIYIDNGKIELKNKGLLTNRINLICEDGIEFFNNFDKKIDLLYLDAWDYRGNDEEKRNSEEKHLECFLKSEKYLKEKSLILIDDISDIETYVGKGHLLIPHLLNNDYKILLKEWQFLFYKENNINYLSGGMLGDFICQLSVIKENFLLTGRKGNLYLVDNDNPPNSFPIDWKNYVYYHINWRRNIKDVYLELKNIILNQEYISDFKIYNNEKLENYIHLSSWRQSSFLYKNDNYAIFKNEYGVEWGSHKWLNLEEINDYKNCIFISATPYRSNTNFNYNKLNQYGKKIYFITTDINEYEEFKKITKFEIELILFTNLIDYWKAINSCYLFVCSFGSFLTVANALYKNTIVLLSDTRDDNHLCKDIPNLKWYKNDNEHNLTNYKDVKILVLSCCYNEEKILPFYLDYYTNFIKVDKIVIYDGGSTDDSQNIIKEYPNVDLIIDPQDKLDDRYLNDVRNNGWKSYRDNYDWIIICDIDEFVYHPNLKEKLLEYDENEITIPLTDGFDMISNKFPKFKKSEFIQNIIKKGILDNVFLSKKSIFKTSININYHIGSHGCDPTGPVKYSDTAEIKHLHFKWLSHKYLTKRSTNVADRLSDWNLSGGCGSHNRPFSLTTLDEFNNKYNQSIQVFESNKNENVLYAFSHNYLINNWEEILNEQLKLIKNSGLYDELTTLFMFAYGNDDEFIKFSNIINLYDDLFRININRIENNFYEYPTLQFLQNFVDKQNKNVYILYFHLKGVWSVNNGGNPEAIKSWRKCLEYFTIEKWNDCVNKLNEGYEIVGALYNYNKLEPLFSGNMWWSTSNYIKKLPKLEYIPEKDPYINEPKDDKTWCRVECEKWINKIPNNFFNFYIPKNYGFYFASLNPVDYRNDLIKNYKISVLIPTYNRFNLLKESIQSVLNQNYNNIEILVCHDGYSIEYDKIKEENKHDKIFYFEIEKRNNYGAAQRNFMLNNITGDYILYLDDDNTIYPDYFEKMIQQIDDQTGMVICKIHYNDKEWYNYVLPLEDRIQDCEIDHLGILLKSDIGKLFEWDDYFGHDHRYIKKCENEINKRGLKIKYVQDVLANHRFFGEVLPRITVVHHCYLRYKWKEILEEQIFLMKINGLYDNCSEIFATIYADDKNNIKEFRNIISREDNLNKWKIIEIEQNNYEFDALKFIKKYSENKHAYICYFHLKGVISEEIEPNIGIPTWRKYLNYFTINKWRENINNLKDNDVVCVDWNFNDMHQRHVLGGNFFWTKSEYIRTLKEPINDENRFLSEIWITSNEKCKVYENFNCWKMGFKNLYLQWFNPILYRKDIDNFVNELVEWSFKKHETQQNKLENKEFIKRIIKHDKTKSILEIGSSNGGTTYSFCNIFDKVFSIDIREEYKMIELCKEYQNLKYIIGKSNDIGTINKLEGLKFDVIYIDGDHSYVGVKNDYLNYKDFINEDGIIIFHDIKRTKFTDSVGIQVPILWDEIKGEYEYEEIINNEHDCYGVGLLYNKKIKKDLENKSVVVMTAHPNFKTSDDITKKSIESLKPLNIDIILSTHCPVSKELQDISTYFIFDKNNPLIRHDYYHQSWFDKKEYYALIKLNKNDNDLQHALAVYINYYNGLLYAKELGYKTAICTNFDIIFHKDDLNIINDKINEMHYIGKKSFFMTSDATEGIHYKTIFFIIDIDFFINNFKYVTNEKDYNLLTRLVGSETNCLENFFYQSLKDKKDELLLQQINEGDLFSKSAVNLFSNIEYFTVLPLDGNDDTFIIWFSSSNSFDDKRKLTIEVFDGTDCFFVKNDEISNNYIFYKKIKFEKNHKYLINCKIIYDDKIKERQIVVDDNSFNLLEENGVFLDKK